MTETSDPPVDLAEDSASDPDRVRLPVLRGPDPPKAGAKQPFALTRSAIARLVLLGVAAAIGIVLLHAAATRGLFSGNEPEFSLSPGGKSRMATRVETAFQEAGRFWERQIRADTGRSGDAPEIVFYSGRTPSACTGTDLASGAFYCRETRTAAYDLVFFDGVERRMRLEADIGIPLAVARIYAEHVQWEFGDRDAELIAMFEDGEEARANVNRRLALQADCMTGAWAARSEASLGEVDSGVWTNLMIAARSTVREQGAPMPDGLDPFSVAGIEERTEAFQLGLDTASPSRCRFDRSI